MKICIIHGSPRKGNTYKVAEMFKKELIKKGDVEFTEFFLNKDVPVMCCGCYNCFNYGEDKCPHVEYIQPIIDVIKEADGLIFTTPVYVMGETAQMKAFLDHCGYLFMVHRPMEEMFSKVAMVISTTAGAGTGYAIKAICRSFDFWGIKRIVKYGISIWAPSWDAMKPERINKQTRILAKKTGKFYKLLRKRNSLRPRLFTKILFRFMKIGVFKMKQESMDKKYWLSKGWDNKKNYPV
jgi:multimeric flavodoxin WrbA